MPLISITGVGPTRATFSSSDLGHSSSGRILSLAVAADPTRLYAGSYAGVWRSDDAGHTWHQMIGPLTETAGPGIFGGIYAPHVYDLAASPVDPDLILAAAAGGQFVFSRDGLYRSGDGGHSWELVITAFVSQIIFAPDDPTLLYAAFGSGIAVSSNSGKIWTRVNFGPGNIWHVAAAPLEANGIRRVYAAGDNQIWYSSDGGSTWSFDPGTFHITGDRQTLANFQVACQIAAGQTPNPLGGFGGGTADAVGNAAQILAVEPGNPARVYAATVGGANGPSYYNSGNIPPDGTLCNTTCKRLAGEASLWVGDFSEFDSIGLALWGQVAGPAVYHGVTSPSGNTYVIAKPTSAGFLLFFSDNSHVHVSQGMPSSHASWHRLEGKDVSEQAGSNVVFVHPDPHALVFTPDFEITLKEPTGVNYPYDQNDVLDQYLGGTIWMANDGGVYWSDDGGRNWQPSSGLETLDPINIAGLFGNGNAPALYIGCGDNDDFFTRDGGQSWGDPLSACGDCDAWFADFAQSTRVLEFVPRDGGLNVITSGSGDYPDASDGGQVHFVPAPLRTDGKPYPSSGVVLRGFRPQILTLATEAALPDGDYIFVHAQPDGSRLLLRTTAISSITNIADWDDPAKAQTIAPLPPISSKGIDIVQAAGGHLNPVFFFADGPIVFFGDGTNNGCGHVWKWDPAGAAWQMIVPGGPPGRDAGFAKRFFVNPYNPELIYLVDSSSIIKVSLDGGESWLPDQSLTQSMTAGGKIKGGSNTVILDMLFMRGESFTHFAFGDAGVFGTFNGFEWFTLLDAIAIPGRAESGFFDPISDPNDRTLYVELEGRSVLRLGGIPGPPPFQPPPPFDLMELAAIVDA